MMVSRTHHALHSATCEIGLPKGYEKNCNPLEPPEMSWHQVPVPWVIITVSGMSWRLNRSSSSISTFQFRFFELTTIIQVPKFSWFAHYRLINQYLPVLLYVNCTLPPAKWPHPPAHQDHPTGVTSLMLPRSQTHSLFWLLGL